MEPMGDLPNPDALELTDMARRADGASIPGSPIGHDP
jgi:hypothetical protein